jgi:hypothetical protein
MSPVCSILPVHKPFAQPVKSLQTLYAYYAIAHCTRVNKHVKQFFVIFFSGGLYTGAFEYTPKRTGLPNKPPDTMIQNPTCARTRLWDVARK